MYPDLQETNKVAAHSFYQPFVMNKNIKHFVGPDLGSKLSANIVIRRQKNSRSLKDCMMPLAKIKAAAIRRPHAVVDLRVG